MKIEYFLPGDSSTFPYSIVHTQIQDGVTDTQATYRDVWALVDGLGRVRVSLEEADPGAGKEAILQNKFITRLRMELVVDLEEYGKVCEALRSLAREWRGVTTIDKSTMQELYVLASITANMSQTFREHNDARADEVMECSIELDALVLECLA
ncbi:hypothetical protein LVJ94_25740 [Pendulispora rubella]|uniref:Uncharacterized protein n=1 Tax=Pendulispora rubella TaxID=2741070 RepID=A0ABZ2LN62_9BACT